MRLQGKVAMITGSGAGLGREGAFLFSEEGASVAVVDVVEERARDVAAAINEKGGAAIAIGADVSVEGDVQEAVRATVERFGRLDVLWNNAGIGDPGLGSVPFEDITEEGWNKVMGVNTTGVFFGCKHAVEPLRKAGGGSIIITSSVAALVAMRGFPIYCVSKAAVNALTRSLAMELGPFNIRVNAICPMDGMSLNFWLPPEAKVMDKTLTELMAEQNGGWDATQWPHVLKSPRAPRFRDNAYAAVYLASDESAYMSGVSFSPTDAGVLASSPMQADGVSEAATALGQAVGAIPDPTAVGA